MLDQLGLRTPSYKVVTVAGTNGKGSCVAMLESIYWHAGYDVGTFTSPHSCGSTSGFASTASDAGDAELVEVFEDIAAALGPVTLSYFEASLVAALALFRRRDPDVVILEVGMGGRLDATNALDTDCALIVSIDLDHREWLGETRDAIGREKAGIVRPGKPVVIGDRAVPRSVLEHVAERGRGAAFDRPRVRFSSRRRRVGAGRATANRAAVSRYRRSAAPSNSRTRPRARPSSMCSPPLCPSAMRRSRPESRTPSCAGAWSAHEVDGVEWVFDVGHNPAAAAVLEHRCAGLPRGRAHVDRVRRDARQGSRRRRSTVRCEAARLVRRASEHGSRCNGRRARTLLESLGAARVHVAADVAAACAAARAAALAGDRVVVYGSFHTVGAAPRSASAILRTLPIG